MDIKKHFAARKDVYVGVGIGATATLAVTAAYLVTRQTGDQNVNTKIVQAFAYKPHATNHVVVEFVERSCLSRPIHLVGTDRYFSSISEAARQTGHTRQLISQCVNGIVSDVKGDVFEALEVV